MYICNIGIYVRMYIEKCSRRRDQMPNETIKSTLFYQRHKKVCPSKCYFRSDVVKNSTRLKPYYLVCGVYYIIDKPVANPLAGFEFGKKFARTVFHLHAAIQSLLIYLFSVPQERFLENLLEIYVRVTSIYIHFITLFYWDAQMRK